MKIFRRKKPASPAQRPSEAELFTDREEFIDAFDDALAGLRPEAPRVLVFHGTSGMGKSGIKNELIRRLEKRREAVTDSDGEPLEDSSDYRMVWANLDFTTAEYRNASKALLILRTQLVNDQAWRIPFRSFDIAYAIKWRKVNQETPLELRTFNALTDSEIIRDVLTLAGKVVPGVSLVAPLTRLVKNVAGELKDWWIVNRSETLQRLEASQPHEIDKALPGLFADDLVYFLNREKLKSVIFMDGYEKLWETEDDRAPHRYSVVDAWVRDLVAAAPGALLVITGHDDVRWREVQDNRIECSEAVTSKHVESLTESDCYTLLERAGITEEPIKGKIYSGSHGVPLYIDLSIDTYYDAVTKGEQAGPDDFGGTYEEIFTRFVERLSREVALTLEAIGPARTFDARLFKAVVGHFDTAFPTAAFGDFVRFSFITEEGDTGTYRIHDLLRDHIKAYAGEGKWREAHTFLFEYYRAQADVEEPRDVTEESIKALSETVYHGLEAGETQETLIWFNGVSETYIRGGFYSELTPVYEILTVSAGETRQKETIAYALGINNLAGLYQRLGRYAEAVPLYKISLKITEKNRGREHPSVAAILNNLATLYQNQGRYRDAERVYHHFMVIKEKALGPYHRDVAATLNNLASLYKTQGRYAEANPLYKRSYQILERTLGRDHPVVATSLNNLALLYHELGKYSVAEPLYERCLAIREKALPETHPDIATTVNNLAGLYQAQGRYRKAELLYQRCLTLREKVFGADHPEVASTLSNIACFYRTLGRYAEAEPLYLRSLTIREKALGSAHTDVANSLLNLGALYRDLGRYSDAERLCRSALEIIEKTLGTEHRHVATILQNIASVYRAQRRYGEAVLLTQRSLAIKEKALATDHPDVGSSLSELAACYRAQPLFGNPEPLYQRALEIAEKALGSEHPDVAAILCGLAGVYNDLTRFTDAEPLYTRALAIWEKALGSDHPDIATLLSDQAHLYVNMGRPADALPNLERSLAIYKVKFPENHPQIINTIIGLSVVYRLLGNSNESYRYAAQAEKLKKTAENSE